ncbi:syncoilin-like [Astyanax mexicanus]|uniref:Syncoilin, intermediate filament protein n=1 Tax=Astyanax mexicanus TaxID=7994 RepID=A0A8B9K8G7_ASTMX|nr:syncoilin-like [Astyanax mexicanus]
MNSEMMSEKEEHTQRPEDQMEIKSEVPRSNWRSDGGEEGGDGSEKQTSGGDGTDACLLPDSPDCPGGPLPGYSGLPVQWGVWDEVECVFEHCMEEVERLQVRRDVLVQELLALERPLQDKVQDLRLELTQVHSCLDHAQYHKHTLQEEAARVKRKLFVVMRDCIQNQITLTAQKYEVEQFTIMQEELQCEVLQRLQELAQMREEQQSRLTALRQRLQGQQRPRAASDLSHCRRASADLSRYTRASMKSLDKWYEPRLLALLRRKQASEDTLRKSRELGQVLKKHVEPLREESRRMKLESEQLQQRIDLMEQERRGRAAQHQETVSLLEECVRELQTELQIQINTNRQLGELNHCLTAQSSVYRRCLGYSDGSDTPDEEND